MAEGFAYFLLSVAGFRASMSRCIPTIVTRVKTVKTGLMKSHAAYYSRMNKAVVSTQFTNNEHAVIIDNHLALKLNHFVSLCLFLTADLNLLRLLVIKG